MKAIVISQEAFETSFKALMKDLELAKLQEERRRLGQDMMLETLHRTFIYKLHAFKDTLEKL